MATYQQRLKRNIGGSAVVLLALLGTIAFTINGSSLTQLIDGTPDPISQENVELVRIQRPEHPDILINKVNNQWLITEPCELPANSQRLTPLLGAVTPAPHAYNTSEVDMDAAGLIEPLASITFDKQRIDIGNTDLSGERRYIKRGSRVEFVPEWILSLANGGLTALAQLTIFPNTISALTLENSTAQTEFTIAQISQWQALSAQQIVTWPLNDIDEPAIISQLHVTTQEHTSLVALHQYPAYTAIVPNNAQCAFLVPNDAPPFATQN